MGNVNDQIQHGEGADFMEEALGLIQAIRYTLDTGDDWLIDFCAQKVEQEIKNACNVNAVPLGLYKVASGLVVAEFLAMKKATGKLNIDSLNFEPVLKQIKEGDTDIVYATEKAMNGEQRFDLFLSSLRTGREQFIAYRRLKW